MQHRKGRRSSRTIALPDLGAEDGTAEVFALVDSGDVSDVRFVSGDERLRDAESRLRGLRVPFIFPDDQPLQLIRQGTVRCRKGSGCTLLLVSATSARMDPR